jgi:signal recognition particle GTPase
MEQEEGPQRTKEEINAQMEQQVRKREEKLKNQPKKKEVKNDHEEATLKLIEYVLYEFDVSNPDRQQVLDEEE